MKKFKKLISAVLILTLCLVVFSGCGKITMDDILKDTNVVVGKVGSQDVYAYEMIYYLRMGATKEQAQTAIAEVKILQEKALENGIEITEDILAKVDEMYAGLEAQLGGEEVIVSQLQEIGVTKDQYTELVKATFQAEAFLEYVSENEIIKKATDEEAKAFFDNNCLKAKHILFSTLTEDGSGNVSQEEANKKKEQALEIYDKIKAGEAFEDFESLNEDPGVQTVPDGYVLVDYSKFTDENVLSAIRNSSFSFDEGFVKGAASVKVDEVAEIVESYAGYHIIKRVGLTEEDFNIHKDAIKTILSTIEYQNAFNTWENSMEIKWNEKYMEALEVTPMSANAAQ